MDTIWTNGIVDLYQGDCREVLQRLPAQSVHCVVTSPPYWGLRDYGIEPAIWYSDGLVNDCGHEWGDWQEHHDEREQTIQGKTRTTDRSYGDESRRFNGNHQKHTAGSFCDHCGAWLGNLGLEPTPELYIEHIVEIFQAIKRVLRDDGTLWLNLGDSYWNGGGVKKDGGHDFVDGGKSKLEQARGSILQQKSSTSLGLKPKDLVGIPWRVAFALQADGWYLRSDIIWQKPNPMPESVTDRPTKSHEYVFLLTKSQKYYYDADAIQEAIKPETAKHVEKYGGTLHLQKGVDASRNDSKTLDYFGNPDGRNKRSVWTIATHPFPEAHFATFPEKLVEPCILAGSPKDGTVLDPFIGSGTTAIVAQRLGRRCIGIDASETYLKDIAIKRITGVSLPMEIDS